MAEIVTVPVSDLLLDTANARLGEDLSSQQAVYLSLAKLQGPKLVALARDVVERGLDPTTMPVVVATTDRHRRYIVLEGNRRILALKALETPSIVTGALSVGDQKALANLSGRYLEDPIDEVDCVLFETQEEPQHWIELRHTGENDGAGLVEWDSNEQNRYRTRHGGKTKRTFAGQILDWLAGVDGHVDSKGIFTNLNRLINSPAVRERIGLRKEGSELASEYPAEELLKPLRKILADLTSKEIRVSDIYYEPQRVEYLNSFDKSELPDPRTKAKTAAALSELTLKGGRAKPKPRSPKERKPRPKLTTRLTVIPKGCQLNPVPPRINAICNELSTLEATTFPNAASVLLRVFVELSVDHYLSQNPAQGAPKQSDKLAPKLKWVSAHLKAAGKIDEQLRRAMDRVANSAAGIAASIFSFNQFVHNKFAYPTPSELFAAWDEIQPIMEQLWP